MYINKVKIEQFLQKLLDKTEVDKHMQVRNIGLKEYKYPQLHHQQAALTFLNALPFSAPEPVVTIERTGAVKFTFSSGQDLHWAVVINGNHDLKYINVLKQGDDYDITTSEIPESTVRLILKIMGL